MVVSEMKERLSPKKAPPTTLAVIRALLKPICSLIPAAMGTRATIVPTLVPIDIETKQAAINSPASKNRPGSRFRVRFTTASIAPIDFAVEANAPASMNIHIIRSTFLSPAPAENASTRFSNDSPLVVRIAQNEARRKAELTGIL